MITVLPTPCWELVDADGDVPELGTHYPDEQAALDDAHDEMEQYGQPVTVRQSAKSCVIVECNDCTRPVDSDEFAHVHFPDAELAALDAREANFAVVGFDAWCEDCRTDLHPASLTDGGPAWRCARSWVVENHQPAFPSA